MMSHSRKSEQLEQTEGAQVLDWESESEEVIRKRANAKRNQILELLTPIQGHEDTALLVANGGAVLAEIVLLDSDLIDEPEKAQLLLYHRIVPTLRVKLLKFAS